MIFLASDFIDYKIVAISSLSEIGCVTGILVDPYTFTVAGFWMKLHHSPQKKAHHFLVSNSVRQIDDQRLLINDIDECCTPDDLPKLTETFDIDYQVCGKRVVSSKQVYLGQVEDFSFHDQDFKIMHIIVKPPLLQRLKITQKRYSRRQIEKIDHRKIEVKIGPQAQSVQSLPTGMTA